MTRLILHLVVGGCIFSLSGVRAPAQGAQPSYVMPVDQIVAGRPWTMFIPDPDRFDWTARNGSRPGYRYRGMLAMQQRFYDYIQQRRRNNLPLSAAEQATIRWLISSRRWPEAPQPNAFWAAFMRYLREQPTLDLNIAQTLMLDQLRTRGLVPVDTPSNPDFDRVRDYLNSGPFRPRNWFERTFGRMEPWMDNLYAGWGYDMSAGAAPSGSSFPAGDPFNGLKITYNVSGATLSAPEDSGSFTISRNYGGVLGSGALTISGTVRVGGFGADVTLSVWAGDKKEDKKFYVENTGSSGNPQTFSLSVPISADARTGGFAIRLDGRYSMGGGHRGCYVTGAFGPSKAQVEADRAAADAKWRKEVEDTLARLGYENTPEGKELAEMRRALAGGDAAWDAFVNARLDQMSGDTSPQVVAFKELEDAMAAGGAEWDKYVAARGTGASPDTSGTAASLVKQGQDFYEKTQYADAASAFTKAIEANPKSPEAYAGRGLARRALNDNAGALADVGRALELDPNSAEAYRGRSMVKRAQSDFQGALADANRAVELAASNYRAYLTRGLAKQALKDPGGAIDDFNRAIQIAPGYAMSYSYRGRARLDTKDNAGALDDYNRFIGTNPADSAAFNNRGLAKQRLGDTAGAIADFERALAIDPKNETAKRNRANLSAAGDIEIFTTMNNGSVFNRPTADATFTLARPHVITMITTYHWNDGRGTGTGTIALRGEDGQLFGPWPVTGTPGQGGVPNATWTCTPSIELPAGTYRIVDSEPATWSWNAQSSGRGLAAVKGRAIGGSRTLASVTPAAELTK